MDVEFLRSSSEYGYRRPSHSPSNRDGDPSTVTIRNHYWRRTVVCHPEALQSENQDPAGVLGRAIDWGRYVVAQRGSLASLSVKTGNGGDTWARQTMETRRACPNRRVSADGATSR